MSLIWVRWSDSRRVMSDDYVEDLPGFAVLETAGFLVLETADALTIARDRYTDEARVRDCVVIPTANVLLRRALQ